MKDVDKRSGTKGNFGLFKQQAIFHQSVSFH